jgi:hypothetical protein
MRLVAAEQRLQEARELAAEIASWPSPLETWLRLLRGEGPNTVVGRTIPIGPALRRPIDPNVIVPPRRPRTPALRWWDY